MSEHVGTVRAIGREIIVARSSAGVEVVRTTINASPISDCDTYAPNAARALAALLVVAADASDRGVEREAREAARELRVLNMAPAGQCSHSPLHRHLVGDGRVDWCQRCGAVRTGDNGEWSAPSTLAVLATERSR